MLIRPAPCWSPPPVRGRQSSHGVVTRASAAGTGSGAPTMPTGTPRGTPANDARETDSTFAPEPSNSIADAWLSTGTSTPRW